MVETSWPPKSPHEALLSSPSGRKKFQQYQERRERSVSPTKRSRTAPNLHDQHIGLLDAEGTSDEDEEDVEVLQLKLAAIQAKLKLKKLQQGRSKTTLKSSDVDIDDNARPRSAASTGLASRSASRLLYGRDWKGGEEEPEGSVQVPLSPTRKQAPMPEPRSPGRVLLGIDKGARGNDVSLRRAPLASDRYGGSTVTREARSSRNTQHNSVRSGVSTASSGLSQTKSFSERIAESRQDEKTRQARAEELRRKRSSGFRLNEAELEGFRAAALEIESHTRLRSPSRATPRQTTGPSRDDVIRASENGLGGLIKRSNTMPSLRQHISDNDFPQPTVRADPEAARRNEMVELSANPSPADSTADDDPAFYEEFSGLQLSRRILPQTFLERQFEEKSTLRIPYLLKHVVAPAWELPDADADFVVFGIVASKSAPKDKKGSHKPSSGKDDWEKKWADGTNNESRYMAITLTDLNWTMDLFLFSTAFTQFHRLSEGTVIAILNPTIMPPPPAKANTNRFSLSLNSSDDTVLEIGTARDLGFCKATKKDGKECMSWINAAKSEFCDWHIDVQVRKTQAGRMGVNTGASMFGPGGAQGSRYGSFGRSGSVRKRGLGGEVEGSYGKGLKKEGQQYDKWNKTAYFVAPAGPANGAASEGGPLKRGKSAASLIDADENFLHSEGFAARGGESKDAKMQKRLVAQEKEREINRKLGKGVAGLGGMGAEYARLKETQRESTAAEARGNDQGLGPNDTFASRALKSVAATARSAEAMKLSPIRKRAMGNETGQRKKTRFVTEKGIREAGRESLGANITAATDDDDDLDIV